MYAESPLETVTHRFIQSISKMLMDQSLYILHYAEPWGWVEGGGTALSQPSCAFRSQDQIQILIQ